MTKLTINSLNHFIYNYKNSESTRSLKQMEFEDDNEQAGDVDNIEDMLDDLGLG
jgi:hypothetical protein